MVYNRIGNYESNRNLLDDIKGKIRLCLKKLYEENAVLFTRNDGKGLCERCIVFRFACYLQKTYSDYFVDCDFNSSQIAGFEGSGKPIENSNGQSSTKRFVDIIIHARTFDQNNDFICFEIKKWNNYNRQATAKDKNNLRVLTRQYGYKYGFNLILGKTLMLTKWMIFRNGEVCEDKCPVFQNEAIR